MRRLRTSTLHVLATCVLASTAFAQQPPAPFSGVPDRENRTYDDSWAPGNTQAFPESISDDGRLVVFSSSMPRLVPEDTNGFMDVFLRDRLTRQTTRVSVNTGNDQANWDSDYGTISGDGRHVAFRSAASNLVPGDTNGHMDFFVRDMLNGTTSFISLGPAGESLIASATDPMSMSHDGRYVAFIGTFGQWPNGYQRRHVWVRDRDADGNGVFDEPGTCTTTLVSRNVLGDESYGWPSSVSISGDGRWVAFASDAQDLPSAPQPESGSGLTGGIYAHDRLLGQTVRVDVPTLAQPEPAWQMSWDPKLSADGRYLLYTSNAAGLVDNDFDVDDDLFIFDLATGGNRQIPVPTPESGLRFYRLFGSSISGDGSRIGFVGDEVTAGPPRRRGFVHDRNTGVSYEIGIPQPDASYSNGVSLVDLSADGAAALFESADMILPDSFDPGVYVAEAFAIPSDEIEVSSNGGTYTFSVQAPATTTWMARSWSERITFAQPTGSGNGLVEFTVGANASAYPEPLGISIFVGSEVIRIRQPHVPVIDYVAPWNSPVGGGGEVQVFGNHFVPGASVRFGSAEATSVDVVDATLIRAVVPPSPDGRAGNVMVTVTNPDGGTTATAFPFIYEDTTPPVVSPVVTGTLGANGWYTSDVTVTWTISDPESDLQDTCPPFTLTEDMASFHMPCFVRSGGGETMASVEIKRDATPPAIIFGTPWPGPSAEALHAARGEEVRAFYTCDDPVSGVSGCDGPVPSNELIDTSHAGAFTFAITAQDDAGNQAQASVPYFVRGPVLVSAVGGSGVYGGLPTVRATLTSDGVPLVNRLVKFYTSGVHFASAWTAANGEAATVSYMWSPNAGAHEVVASFAGDDVLQPAEGPGLAHIAKLTPAITWGAIPPTTYPAPLAASSLTASANYPGTFTYNPAPGTVLLPGEHVVTVTFTPTDAANYNVATATRTLTVLKGTPVITWPALTPIVYPTPVSNEHLNATANMPGTFAYTVSAGMVFEPGSWALKATFTPSDPNYTTAERWNTLDVSKATPQITWPAPAPIEYGTRLSSAHLNASANVAGFYTYSPTAGMMLLPGTHTLTVQFVPIDFNRYRSTSASTTLTVTKAQVPLTWADPAPIQYGTALGAAQLNATVAMTGTYSYSPAAGTTLPAGTHVLSVTFTPASGYEPYYVPTTITRSLTVLKATPVLSWPAPAPVAYGTALGAAQLNATSSVAGSFSYSPAAGTVLDAGTHTLNATFTPDDATNYDGASASVAIAVNRAATSVNWEHPSAITYGTVLSATQLNATTNVSGTFTYSPAAGTVLGAGTHMLNVTFTPNDMANYNPSTASVSIAIAKAALTIATDDASKVYGAAVPAFTASGSGFVNGETMDALSGSLSFSTSATPASAPGSYPVTPSGVTSANYTISFAAGTLTVTTASTTTTLTTSPNPSQHNKTIQMRATVAPVAPGAGTPTGAVQFWDGGTFLGTAQLVNGVATRYVTMRRGTHQLTATYAGDTNFTSSSGTRTHQTN